MAGPLTVRSPCGEYLLGARVREGVQDGGRLPEPELTAYLVGLASQAFFVWRRSCGWIARFAMDDGRFAMDDGDLHAVGDDGWTDLGQSLRKEDLSRAYPGVPDGVLLWLSGALGDPAALVLALQVMES